MKLLILFVIVYLGYKTLKSWMLQNTAMGKTVSQKATREIDDIMVKDPFCEVHFPKRNGVHLRMEGKDLYFCSMRCRDGFVQQKNES